MLPYPSAILKLKIYKSITKSADLIFAACGKANFIDNTMVKDDAVIIDIGINPITDETKKTGYRLLVMLITTMLKIKYKLLVLFQEVLVL